MIIMLVTVCYAADKIINMNGDDKEGAEEIRNLAVSSRNAKQSEQLDYIMKTERLKIKVKERQTRMG